MKPIVYFDLQESKEDKNKVIVSKERLKEILDEVYNAGFSDGNRNGTYYKFDTTPYISTTPYVVSTKCVEMPKATITSNAGKTDSSIVY